MKFYALFTGEVFETPRIVRHIANKQAREWGVYAPILTESTVCR